MLIDCGSNLRFAKVLDLGVEILAKFGCFRNRPNISSSDRRFLAHLRTTPGVLPNRPINTLQNSNSSPNPNPNSNSAANLQQQPPQSQSQPQKQKQVRPLNQVELQMAYQDALRVCHPDFKRPFSSLEDACERLLPYHVVADCEAEEDDRVLDSDPTAQMPSRSQ
ncbi:hypothetical protein V6N12_072764 [Hibiscus sabdariffa]|uniref:GLTSCR protein conserved domain-containing protein n=1 Tax=Hibiscus sabdariffa TaxID=183260 RepID=A0ABR2BK27_9ROSI